jgi:hypothetical protein
MICRYEVTRVDDREPKGRAQTTIGRLPMALRYPYSGDLYLAERHDWIRVQRAGSDDLWGYFNGDGQWLEGPLRSADPTFCRYMSSGCIVAERSRLRSES